MSLTVRSPAVSVAFGVVSFFMTGDRKTVRVDVEKELLARIEGAKPASKAAYVERLTRHRWLFAQIAEAKYDDGQYEPDVSVFVVRITEDDLG
jgi:hypothetical protein